MATTEPEIVLPVNIILTVSSIALCDPSDTVLSGSFVNKVQL